MRAAEKFGLPPEFDNLPSVEFSRLPATSRTESARTDKIYDVQSLSQLVQEMQSRLEDISPTSSRPAKRKR